MFDKRVLRKIFGPKRDKVTGEGRRLHNEELYELYSSPTPFSSDKIQNEMGGTCSTYGEKERCIKGFGGES